MDGDKNWERDCGLRRALIVGLMKEDEGGLKMIAYRGREDVIRIYMHMYMGGSLVQRPENRGLDNLLGFCLTPLAPSPTGRPRD